LRFSNKRTLAFKAPG